MPIYGKKCNRCNHEFEVFASMSNYNKANSEPCPNCNEIGFVESMIIAVAGIDPMRLGRVKPSSEFKERLQRIHETTAGSTLNQHSNIVQIK